MSFNYFEHASDVGIEATGATLEQAIEAGVEAMLALMFDLATVEEGVCLSVEASAHEMDLLFVEVLNAVLSIQAVNETALKRLRVEVVETTSSGIVLRGVVCGERFNAARHVVRTEVKAATYSGLSYERAANGAHVFRCVVDV